jgi:hypothetical protein
MEKPKPRTKFNDEDVLNGMCWMRAEAVIEEIIADGLEPPAVEQLADLIKQMVLDGRLAPEMDASGDWVRLMPVRSQ